MTRRWTPETTDPALSALARTPVLLVALDFDGTASLHVDDPMAARALPEVADAVRLLSALPDTAVAYASGRSMPDLRLIAEHDDDSDMLLSGSHGAQYWFPGEGSSDRAWADADELAAVSAEVSALVATFPGVLFEPKTLGFGVHTRQVTPEVEERAFAAVDDYAATRIPAWRRRPGHHIREFSVSETGKDTAVAVLREHSGATGVLFAGDDVTDEDALRTLGANDVGVRVGEGESSALLRVDNPQQIAVLLGVLARERASARE